VDYRPYTTEDFAALFAIEEACFQPPFRFGRRMMQRLVNSPHGATWIAVEEERLAGFAIVEWTEETSGVVGYIQTIEVAPDWRGQGIGGELLLRAEGSALAAGAQGIRLHVDVENAAAIRLYETNGYQNEGRAEGFYALGRAALVYGKPLGA
jgi:ribosomal protein S18 acetylase RimI-like enzyme